jgi:inositol-pentakisphosphate 2-kinase
MPSLQRRDSLSAASTPMANASSKQEPQTPQSKIHHQQRTHISSTYETTTRPIQLSNNDHTMLANLNMSHAQYCIATSGQTPEEASVCFRYFNQGGANVVFKISPHPRSNAGVCPSFLFVDAKIDSPNAIPVHRCELVNKVLRVNKGLSKTLRSEEVISGFYGHVWPLFAPGASLRTVVRSSQAGYTLLPVELSCSNLTIYLMDHQGVLLHPAVIADLTAKCDAIRKEHTTPKLSTTKRWGILLPDLSPEPGSSVTIEIKPKWLAQSPTAPSDAIRCRTCALQLVKPKDPKKYLCPLQLLSGTWDTIHPWIWGRVAEQIAEHSKPAGQHVQEHTNEIAFHLARYITEGDGKALLQHLRALQVHLDHHGVLNRQEMKGSLQEVRDTCDHNLRLAMTLRDCSLYLRIKYTSSGVDPCKIECKLGDLDFKSVDKMDDWANKERELLESDAYKRQITEGMDCLISRPCAHVT